MGTKPLTAGCVSVTAMQIRSHRQVSAIIPTGKIDYAAVAAIASSIPQIGGGAPLSVIAAACNANVGRANRVFREFLQEDIVTRIRFNPPAWNPDISEIITGHRRHNRAPLYEVIPTVALLLYFRNFTPKRKQGECQRQIPNGQRKSEGE